MNRYIEEINKYIEPETNDLNEWKRSKCISMPMSDTDSNRCKTPDGESSNCSKCRYHVDKVNRP